MRVPLRRAQRLHTDDDVGPVHLTQEGYAALKQTLTRIEQQLPTAKTELQDMQDRGDLSENAEYQEAKQRLRTLNSRTLVLQDRLRRAQIIQTSSASNAIRIGSYVTLQNEKMTRTFQLVGTHESRPSHGRISTQSPLGRVLLSHACGDTVTITTDDGPRTYTIMAVTSSPHGGA